MLKKTLMVAVSSAALLYATGASAFFVYDVEAIQKQNYAGGSFSANLAREYKDFATFEAYEMYDWIDAEHFAHKAISANSGQSVMPEEVADWHVKEKYVAELTTARTDMMNEFSRGARTAAPAEAAKAQAKYDCWIEQQEENHQWAHIAACKGEFYTALNTLKAAMQPKVVSETKTNTINVPERGAELVYFDFDSANLSTDAVAKLDRFVNTFEDKNAIELDVIGHADRAGASDYNRALSRQRATAVITELRKRGMMVADVQDVDVVARGETDTAVATADGVAEAANRRVEIRIRAVQPVTQTTTTTIVK
tara:strand:- start:3729 stop:4658 length:930 start_codon:yes stop_codon:yes gene_type:complete